MTTQTDTPIAEGHQRVTNREIMRIHAALTALSGRRLAGPDSVKKVSTLLRLYFEQPYRIAEDVKNAIIGDHPAPEEWDGEALPVALAEVRGGLINDLMSQTQDIRAVPKRLHISIDDMPKPIKGELGDQNQFGVADIQHKLGFLFVSDGEGEEDGTRAEE